MAREKGKVAEREVAALLAEWWAPLEPGCSFLRTPMSGGWQAPAVRAEFRACGDIMTTAKRFPWCVEVKRREGWAWGPLLAGRPSPVLKWWAQASRDATAAGLGTMLWFRHNNESWWVMLRAEELLVSLIPQRYVIFLGAGEVLVHSVALLAVQPERLLSSGP